MEISNRIPKVRRFGTSKNNFKKRYNKKQHIESSEQEFSYLKKLSHPELRELQRYNTLNVNKKEIVDAICNDKAVIINQNSNFITALVRYSSRYYIVVMDAEIKAIKTFLPDNISNFLDYVQMLMDKENKNKMVYVA